jgi:amidase
VVESRRRLDQVFGSVDLLMTPTTPGRPHGHAGPGAHLSVALTWGFNLTGHPAVSVPAGFTRDGAPVGLQLVTRHDHDAALLELVARYCAAVEPAPLPRHDLELIDP